MWPACPSSNGGEGEERLKVKREHGGGGGVWGTGDTATVDENFSKACMTTQRKTGVGGSK